MSETLYTQYDLRYLVDLRWQTPTLAAHRAKLGEVLDALDREDHALGALTGRLRAALEPDPVAVGGWQVEAYAEPLVVLPDEHLHATDWDDADLWSGELPLAAVTDPAPPGLRTWRILGTPAQHTGLHALFVRIGGELSQETRSLWLDVRSGCDLWLPKRLDGEASPLGAANAALLATWFRRIGEATGASMRP